MSALASLLARDDALPVGKVQEAIQEQVMSGGNLDTVILELDLMEENEMSAYCAAVYGMLPATRHEVMNASDEIAHILTREFAVRHRFVPVGQTDESVVLAVDRPLALNVLDDIQTELRIFPAQRIVTTIRLESGLRRFFGIEMTARMRRLDEWLLDRSAGTVPYVAPSDGGGVRSPHPPSLQGADAHVEIASPMFSDPPRRSMPPIDPDDTPIRSSSIPMGAFGEGDSSRVTQSSLPPKITQSQTSEAGQYSWRPADLSEELGRSSLPPPSTSRPPSGARQWRPSSMPSPVPQNETPKRPSVDPRRDNDGTGLVHDIVHLGPKTPSGAPRNADSEPAQRRTSRPPRSPIISNANVIVDMGEDVERIIDELWGLSPDDDTMSILPILGVGEAALPVLVQAFPGPLWFDRGQPYVKLPAGRDISPVARAFVAFGDRSVSYVATLIDHRNPNIRYYATLLSSEFVHRKLVAPVGRRLFEDDVQTRTVAFRSLAGLRGCGREFQELLGELRSAARVPSDLRTQLIAIDALGRLRDVDSITMLTPLLNAEDEEVVTTTHASLVRLCCQDFGASRNKWDGWYAAHAGQHRIEWLIDALVHSDARLRRRAGDELKHMTQVYLGFHPGLSPHDLEVAQTKYQRWWSTEGSRIFQGTRV